MRLPFAKIYRAFPEFDPFPDDECQRYIRYAYSQARARIGCFPALAFGLAFIGYVTLLVLGALALDMAGVDVGDFELFPLFAIVSIVCVPSIIALLVRDRVLHRVLMDRIRTARCPACAFSLLGLPVEGGATRCPECGTHIVLSMHNLTPEDLLIRRVDERTAGAVAGGVCIRCEASLRGSPIGDDDSVRCKECGHVQRLTALALARKIGGGRTPEGYVDAAARITACPTCRTSLIGLPVFDGQARCMECGFVASVVKRPGDNAPPMESASEAALRIKRRREAAAEPTKALNSEEAEQAGASGEEKGQ